MVKGYPFTIHARLRLRRRRRNDHGIIFSTTWMHNFLCAAHCQQADNENQNVFELFHFFKILAVTHCRGNRAGIVVPGQVVLADGDHRAQKTAALTCGWEFNSAQFASAATHKAALQTVLSQTFLTDRSAF